MPINQTRFRTLDRFNNGKIFACIYEEVGEDDGQVEIWGDLREGLNWEGCSSVHSFSGLKEFLEYIPEIQKGPPR